MPSIAELQTWLLDSAIELSNLERRISRRGLPESSRVLRVRLALISELLAAQRDGVALVSAEQQLLELMLSASLDRLRSATAEPSTSSPNDGPELLLEEQPPNAGA